MEPFLLCTLKSLVLLRFIKVRKPFFFFFADFGKKNFTWKNSISRDSIQFNSIPLIVTKQLYKIYKIWLEMFKHTNSSMHP